ncbi:MAG: hypothetical protein QNJ90_00740 [Planctomycetota bacterium]|nr:hypothetical protein [Planctomycetota bacterium]
MRARAWSLLTLLLLLPSAPTWAEDAPATAPTPWVKHISKDEKVIVEVPPTWKVKADPKTANANFPIVLRGTIEGHEGEIVFFVQHLPKMAEPLQQAYEDKADEWKEKAAGDVTVLREPRIHLKVDVDRGGGDLIRLLTYRSIRGRGFTVALEAGAAAMEAERDNVFRVADALRSKLGPYPTPIEGYERSVRGGWTYHVHPDVKAADVKGYHKLLKQVERDFVKQHGKLPRKTPHEYAVVFSTHRGASAAHFKKAGKSGHAADAMSRRVYASPMHPTDGTAPCVAREALWQLFLRKRYGTTEPFWFRDGERKLAYLRAAAGGALPKSTEYLTDQPSPPERVFTIADRPEEGDNLSEFQRRQTLYVAMFQAGPAKYRHAYKRFLKAHAAGEDWYEAATKHLLSLNLETMRTDAARFLAKVRKASGWQ